MRGGRRVWNSRDKWLERAEIDKVVLPELAYAGLAACAEPGVQQGLGAAAKESQLHEDSASGI